MKDGAMLTVLSSLVAALAWPATLVTTFDLIDSKWAVAVDRLVLFFCCSTHVISMQNGSDDCVKQQTHEGQNYSKNRLCVALNFLF